MELPLSPLVRQLLAVVCVTGATVIPSYISGALTVALPSIGAQIGLTGSSLQWPLSVFSLIIGAFLLLSGGVADGTSRKGVFLLGNIWMAVFSIPLALSKQANSFIALCAVMGLGPAMLGPAATGILSETLPDGQMKNGAFAALGAGQPLGFIVGLFFGGVFATQHSVIFSVAAGSSALFGALAFIFVPNTDDSPQSTTIRGEVIPRQRISLLRFDWLGAALSAFGLIGLTLAMVLAGTTSQGWKAPSVISLLPIGICLLVGFFIWERQSQRQALSTPHRSGSDSNSRAHALRGPLIPPPIWSAPGFSPALTCVFFGWLAFNSLTYYCTLFLQEIQGTTPIQTSLRFLPMVAAGIVANVLGGVLIGRVKPVYLIIGGCLTCAVSCIVFATQNVRWSYARGMLAVVIMVVGPDVFFPVIQLFACKSVGRHRAALAGSLFNVTTRLATSIGLAVCSLVQGATTRDYASKHGLSVTNHEAVMYGYRSAAWFCFASSMLAATVGLVWLRGISVHPAVVEIPSEVHSLEDLSTVPARAAETRDQDHKS